MSSKKLSSRKSSSSSSSSGGLKKSKSGSKSSLKGSAKDAGSPKPSSKSKEKIPRSESRSKNSKGSASSPSAGDIKAKGKSKVKARFRVTLLDADHLPKRAKGKFLYVTWKRGSKEQNRGESRYILVPNSCKAAWNEPFEVVGSFVRDNKAGTYKTTSPELVFRVMIAGDNATERIKRDKKDKKDKRDKNSSASSSSSSSVPTETPVDPNDPDKKKKKLTGAQRHKLRTEHKEFASIFIDLLDYMKDGSSVKEDLALNDTDPPSSISLKVETTWLKVDGKLVKRIDKNAPSDSSVIPIPSSSSSSSSLPEVVAPSVVSSSLGSITGSAFGAPKTAMYGDDEYEVMTDLNYSDDDDCTSMPTMTGDDGDEGTQDDFSDEGDPFTLGDDGFGIASSSSDSQLPNKRRGSIGTSSEMGPRPSKTKPTLSKTTSASHLPQTPKFKKRPIPLVPQNLEKPKLSRAELTDLSDALHYVLFFPLEHLWDLQHSPQTLLMTLQQALAISQTEQDGFLDRILPTCNYEHILVQLDRQLQAIAQHRFYTVKAFPTPDMYNFWRDAETGRIKRLIDRIYKNNAGIEPTASFEGAPYDRFPSLDFHQMFRLLNKVLHYYDSVNKTIDHKVSVLSQQSTWLLKEFGERYQVNPLFRTLSMMELLVTYWTPSSPRLSFLLLQMMKLQQLLRGQVSVAAFVSSGPDNDDDEQRLQKAPISIPELAFMKSIFHDLDARVSESFSEFYALSKGGKDGPSPLKSLIATLEYMIDLEPELGGEERTFHDVLYDMIRDGIASMYEKMMASAGGHGPLDPHDDDHDDDDGPPLTPQQMSTVGQMITEELKVLRSGASIFEFDVVALAARGFMKWYHEDLVRFCATSTKRFSAREILEVSGPAYALGTDLSAAADNLKVPVNLGPMFEPFLNQYLLETLNQQRGRIDAFVSEDQWVATQDAAACATGLPNILSEMASPLKFIQKYEFLGSGTFETRFGTYVIDPVVGYLLQQVFRSFLSSLPGCNVKLVAKILEAMPPGDLARSVSDLPALITKIRKLRPDVAISEGSFKPASCIRLNSIAAIADAIHKSFVPPSQKQSQLFTSTLDSVAANSERFFVAAMTFFAAWINGDIEKNVKNWMKKDSKSSSQSVRETLHIYFDVISRVLLPRAGLLIAQSLWRIVLADLSDTLRSGGKVKPKEVEKSRPCIEQILDILLSFGFSQLQSEFRSQMDQTYQELFR
ncbi:MAG: hypothetical protein Q8P67_14370 [archaeon]|nr:hypothetical protein [archaeon]